MNTVADANGEVGRKAPVASVETLTTAKTLTVEDLGKTFNVATDALVHVLPAVGTSPDSARAGSKVKFRNTGADGNNLVTVSPNSVDQIFGSIANAAADSVSAGALDKDIINTKATANKGDWIELESDGVTGWYITGGVGIWASEA